MLIMDVIVFQSMLSMDVTIFQCLVWMLSYSYAKHGWYYIPMVVLKLGVLDTRKYQTRENTTFHRDLITQPLLLPTQSQK